MPLKKSFFFLRYKFVCDEVQKIFALASTVTLMSVGSHREMKTNNYYGGFAWYYTRYPGLSIRHRVVLLASRFNTQTNYSLINLLFVFAFSYIPYVAKKKKKEKEKIIPLFYWSWCQSWEMPLWTRPEVIVSRDTKTKIMKYLTYS